MREELDGSLVRTWPDARSPGRWLPRHEAARAWEGKHLPGPWSVGQELTPRRASSRAHLRGALPAPPRVPWSSCAPEHWLRSGRVPGGGVVPELPARDPPPQAGRAHGTRPLTARGGQLAGGQPGLDTTELRLGQDGSGAAGCSWPCGSHTDNPGFQGRQGLLAREVWTSAGAVEPAQGGGRDRVTSRHAADGWLLCASLALLGGNSTPTSVPVSVE